VSIQKQRFLRVAFSIQRSVSARLKVEMSYIRKELKWIKLSVTCNLWSVEGRKVEWSKSHWVKANRSDICALWGVIGKKYENWTSDVQRLKRWTSNPTMAGNIQLPTSKQIKRRRSKSWSVKKGRRSKCQRVWLSATGPFSSPYINWICQTNLTFDLEGKQLFCHLRDNCTDLDR